MKVNPIRRFGLGIALFAISLLEFPSALRAADPQGMGSAGPFKTVVYIPVEIT